MFWIANRTMFDYCDTEGAELNQNSQCHVVSLHWLIHRFFQSILISFTPIHNIITEYTSKVSNTTAELPPSTPPAIKWSSISSPKLILSKTALQNWLSINHTNFLICPPVTCRSRSALHKFRNGWLNYHSMMYSLRLHLLPYVKTLSIIEY